MNENNNLSDNDKFTVQLINNRSVSLYGKKFQHCSNGRIYTISEILQVSSLTNPSKEPKRIYKTEHTVCGQKIITEDMAASAIVRSFLKYGWVE